MSFMNDFNHLKVTLEDIKSATNDFGDKPIGIGGFGKVYKGELSLPNGENKTVAFKRLDRQYGQGDVEFWKEIMMLSPYKHENLISLVGYSDDDGERILVYEYASGGSLDCKLGKTSLTWNQFLKICVGAARGLNCLHDPVDRTQPRVLHRDVKSSNILLDENLTAKISDFGLSKFGPAAHQQYTYLVTGAVGTQGYCDPMYMETGSLSKESDVYSFGVVLFEVMCGRSCFESCSNGEQNILVHKWKKCYQENGIYDIISNHLKEQMDTNICYRDSVDTFASIAYRCLNRDRKERPTMAEVVKELVMALDIQEISGDVDERNKYAELVSIAKQATTPQHDLQHRDPKHPSPITGRSRTELALILSKGIHVLKSEHVNFFYMNLE
uniref:probable receptor-like protein kinase At5g59700 n=1 Tax=Erigeron canadensis TaxID=72917 RepID=UPI001CB988DB|nr:probable receptor-like protein kinase At5g59700 [Erigeron canadensis]